MKKVDHKDMIKKPSEFCSSAFVTSPHPLSPTPSTSSAMKTPENIAKDPDDPQAADNTFQMEYSSD